MSQLDGDNNCDTVRTESEPSSAQAPRYDAWFDEVMRFAKEELNWSAKAIASIDRVAWREYFDEGLTPKEAWQEEYDAAS
jgi:hypothetical protein